MNWDSETESGSESMDRHQQIRNCYIFYCIPIIQVALIAVTILLVVSLSKATETMEFVLYTILLVFTLISFIALLRVTLSYPLVD